MYFISAAVDPKRTQRKNRGREDSRIPFGKQEKDKRLTLDKILGSLLGSLVSSLLGLACIEAF